MQYIVNNEYSRYFEVATDRNDTVGNLDFSGWRPTKADLALSDGTTYTIEPLGIWNTTIQITKGDTIIAGMKYNWNASISIMFANGREFTFKRQKRWSGDWLMVNDMEDAIGLLSVSYKWSTMGFDYHLQLEPDADRQITTLLPFIMLYCVKFMRIRGMVVN